MGQNTPNMSIYLPAAGETNYDASFASGMVNVDQHDHSGAPNKGVQISTTSIGDGSITYQKLNANVADTTTGLGTDIGPNANKLITLGFLKSLFQIPGGTNGFVYKNGAAASARTFVPTANQIDITNPDGIAGAPVWSISSPLNLPGALNVTGGDVTISGPHNLSLTGNANITGNLATLAGGTITSAGLVTAHAGITFDSVNTLSAYTTGTFNMTFTTNGSSVGWTYTAPGKYWKVGKLVYFCINFNVSGKTGVVLVGSSRFTGLPFAAANDGFNNVFTVEPVQNITYSFYLVGEVIANTDYFYVSYFDNTGAGGRSMLDNTAFHVGSTMIFSGFYWTA
jgi:hypothetical protein